MNHCAHTVTGRCANERLGLGACSGVCNPGVCNPKDEADQFMRFPSGARRSSHVAGTRGRAVRFDLISPVLLRRLAETYAEGAVKYGDHNWQKGIPVSDLLNRTLAHVVAYMEGDRSEDHIGHAMWNLGTIAHFEERPPCSQSETGTSSSS